MRRVYSLIILAIIHLCEKGLIQSSKMTFCCRFPGLISACPLCCPGHSDASSGGAGEEEEEGEISSMFFPFKLMKAAVCLAVLHNSISVKIGISLRLQERQDAETDQSGEASTSSEPTGYGAFGTSELKSVLAAPLRLTALRRLLVPRAMETRRVTIFLFRLLFSSPNE